MLVSFTTIYMMHRTTKTTFVVFSQILQVRFTEQVGSSSNTSDMYLGDAMFTLYYEVFHEFLQFLQAGARIVPCSKT